MEEHDNAVNKIAIQITRLHEQKKGFKIYHGSTNSTRKTVVTRDSVVDTKALSRVLSVNQSAKTALVEPNVSFDRLVRAVLPYNLLPPVVPEFPAITIGGAIAGMAGESSSFKYGFVSDTVEWMQLILSDGTITTATRGSNADLFDGVMGTFGSVAVVVLLEIKLVKAAQFVRLTYSPANSVPDLLRSMEQATESQENDFVDSILYRRDRGVVVRGTFAASVGTGEMIQRHSRARDEW